MLDSELRPVTERMLRPMIAVACGRVHPIVITVAALLVGAACVLALLQGSHGMALFLWLLNRYLDGLDGGVARASETPSDFGGYIDILADFAVYAAIPIAAVLALPQGATTGVWLALAILLSSFYVNAASWLYLSALLEKRGHGTAPSTSIVMPTGLIEGTETILLFSLLIILPSWTAALLWGMASLVFLTAMQRVFWAARHLTPR